MVTVNSCNSTLETGWAITAHAVGLGRPMDEHLETTGKPVPGYNGNQKKICVIVDFFFFCSFLSINFTACIVLVFSHFPVKIVKEDSSEVDRGNLGKVVVK